MNIECNNPQRASVIAKTQTCNTDFPSRFKSPTLSITPSHHHHDKMVRSWTSRTHKPIHTGVIVRCCHVHLMHQIHGVFWHLSCSQGQPVRWFRAPNPWCSHMIILKKKGSQKKWKLNWTIPKDQAHVPVNVGDSGWFDALMHQTTCGSWVQYPLGIHVREVCDFFLARCLRVHSGISGFLPLLRKRKKEIPWTLWEIMQRRISQMPSLASSEVESGFSGRKKGMAILNKSLCLFYGCLWQPIVGFVCDGRTVMAPLNQASGEGFKNMHSHINICPDISVCICTLALQGFFHLYLFWHPPPSGLNFSCLAPCICCFNRLNGCPFGARKNVRPHHGFGVSSACVNTFQQLPCGWDHVCWKSVIEPSILRMVGWHDG